jgi:hypothetical protein
MSGVSSLFYIMTPNRPGNLEIHCPHALDLPRDPTVAAMPALAPVSGSFP